MGKISQIYFQRNLDPKQNLGWLRNVLPKTKNPLCGCFTPTARGAADPFNTVGARNADLFSHTFRFN